MESLIENVEQETTAEATPTTTLALTPIPISTETLKEVVETCVELKNIQYKTMLLKGSPIAAPRVLRASDNVNNLDKFLEDEKSANVKDSWSNLDKSLKMKKLIAFAETYKVENVLTEEEYDKLLTFLKESLDRKKLQRVKDVSYDKVTGAIKSIPALTFNKPTSHFTLKNVDKRVSTLKSLPPKKNRGTIKA